MQGRKAYLCSVHLYGIDVSKKKQPVGLKFSSRGTGDGKGDARGAVSSLPGGRALRASAGASRWPQSSGAEYSAP